MRNSDDLLRKWANGYGQDFRQLRDEWLQTRPENYTVAFMTFL
jgi:hypothetical protein